MLKVFHLFLLLIIVSCSNSVPKYSTITTNEEKEKNYDAFCKIYDQYYPNFEIHSVNWDSIKNVYRQKALSANSEKEFISVLREIISPLHDPHCEIISPHDETITSKIFFNNNDRKISFNNMNSILNSFGTLPCRFSVIDNDAVVSFIDTTSDAYNDGLRLGMKLEKINDIPIEKFIKENFIYSYRLESGISRLVNNYLFFRDAGDKVKLSFSYKNMFTKDFEISYSLDNNKTLFNYASKRYIKNYKKLNTLEYGYITDEIGYIYIPSFLGETVRRYKYKIFFYINDGPVNENLKEFESVLKEFQNTKGIIIDARNNRGGNQSIGRMISSYLVQDETIEMLSRYRDREYPVEINKLTPLRRDFIYPYHLLHQWHKFRHYDGQYTKPVVVIQNEGCLSATETFISAMKHIPSVTTVGVTTGGSSTNPMFSYLPNGLLARVSTRQSYWDTDKLIERKGIQPDVEVTLTLDDILHNNDKQLEKAIELLNQD